MLSSSTTCGTCENLPSTCEITASAAASDSHSGRRPPGRLGRHLPQNNTYHLSPFCEIVWAYNSHLPTTPAARPSLMHRSPNYMGSNTGYPSDRDHTKHPSGLSRPPGSPGSDFHSHPYGGGGSPPDPQPPRVPMFQYPIPDHTLETWKSKVMTDSYTAIMLAKATALSLRESLEFPIKNNISGRRSGSLIGHQNPYHRTAKHATRYPWGGNGHGLGHVPSQEVTLTD